MKSSNTVKHIQKAAMKSLSIYKWKCPCCGPKDSIERRRVHKVERLFGKAEVEDYMADENDLSRSLSGDFMLHNNVKY